MKTLITPALTTLLQAVLLSMVCSTDLMAKDRKEIEIRGRILLDGAPIEDLILIVVVNDMDCIPFDLYPDGRFELSVAVDSKAEIRFEKQGYLSKEVTVDTRNALLTDNAAKNNKRLEFDVQMQPLPRKEKKYAGPVGTINFVNGSGTMKVRVDRTMIDVNDKAVLREAGQQ